MVRPARLPTTARKQGCDETFIQCCIDDLQEGAEVTVIFGEDPPCQDQ